MSGLARKFTAASVAATLVAVPTGAIAATPAPVSQPATQQAAAAASANPWLVLSAMTSSSSSTATAAAAQDDSGPGFPPIAPLIVILGTIGLAIWILVSDDSSSLDFEPASP